MTDQIVPDRAQVAAEPGAASPGVMANPDFAKLWAGETVSRIGSQVTQFAMPLVAVLSLNATVFEVGVLNALRFVPVIFVSLFAGVWLDGRRRRPVLICCSLANALLIGLVPLSASLGFLSIGLLCAVALLVGTLTVVFDVGALSYVPFLVPRQDLPSANSKIQASNAFAGIAGPGIAGLLIGLVTAPVTLSADAVSYLFSAAGLLSIRRPEPAPDPAAVRPSVRRSIAEGFHAVYGTPLLRALLTQSALLNIGFGAISTVFTVYGLRVLHLSPLRLGVAVGALAVGALAGSLGASRVQDLLGFGRTLTVAILGVCLSPLLLLIPSGGSGLAMVALIAGWLGHGCGISIWNVNTITMRQALTPMHVLARMNATYRMLLFGALPLGAMAGGLLGSAFGLRHAMVISALLLTTPILWIFFSPVFRLTQMPQGPLSALPDCPPDDGDGES
jgi:MFS family permease